MALSDRDFLGLEVVGLDEASIVGSVRDLIVDDETGSVAALVVDVDAYQCKVVPYTAVRSVGMDAVVISSSADAVLVGEAPKLAELAQKDIQLVGCLVLTNTGHALGVIDGFLVDDASGRITELQVEPEEEESGPFRIPADSLLKVGDDIVIITSPQALGEDTVPRTALASDLVGLQIVSRDEADVVGQVDALIIDEQNLALAGFIVNLGLYEPLSMAREAAEVIGPHAVLIASASAIRPLSSEPALEKLAMRKTSATNTRAVTVSGKAVGTICDLSVDTVTGSVLGLEFVPAVLPAGDFTSLLLPLSCVVKLGKDLAVVSDDYADCVTPLAAAPALTAATSAPPEVSPPHETADSAPRAAKCTESSIAPVVNPMIAPTGEPIREQAPRLLGDAGDQPGDGTPHPHPAQPRDEHAPVSSETSSRHFLLGKRLLRRLELPSGEAIAEAGDEVTPELIARVKEHNLLLVLSLNVE